MKQVYLDNIFVTINVICTASCFVIVVFFVCRFLWGFGGEGGGVYLFIYFFNFNFLKNFFSIWGGWGRQFPTRCRLHGRAFAHGATGRRIDPLGGVCRPCHQIDPSWWTPISRSNQCSTTGVTKAVLSCLWDGAYKRALAANWKE